LAPQTFSYSIQFTHVLFLSPYFSLRRPWPQISCGNPPSVHELTPGFYDHRLHNTGRASLQLFLVPRRPLSPPLISRLFPYTHLPLSLFRGPCIPSPRPPPHRPSFSPSRPCVELALFIPRVVVAALDFFSANILADFKGFCMVKKSPPFTMDPSEP